MYKLYYLPGACSLAIHALLIELGQPVELINRNDVADYTTINPTGAVPTLQDGDMLIQEGAAIALYLAEKHGTDLLPAAGVERAVAINWLMFANATMHPAYSKLFFVARAVEDADAKTLALAAAGASASKLWAIVDARLSETQYVAGAHATIADLMLTVYANWSQYFPGQIVFGPNVQRLLAEISRRPAFQKALAAEKVAYGAITAAA